MTKPVVKEKPVSLVEEMLTSLLDMTKLFQNSDFVSLKFVVYFFSILSLN